MSEFNRENNPETKETKHTGDFEIGDMVILDETITKTEPIGFGGNTISVVQALIEKHGKGPFIVRTVRSESPELIRAGHPRQRLFLEDQNTGTKFPTTNFWFKKYSE